MTNEEKIEKLRLLMTNINDTTSLEILGEMGALKQHYDTYMTTSPINCDQELERLDTADFDLCCALYTMLLREDHFCEGIFGKRIAMGQVEAIILRMIELLEEETEIVNDSISVSSLSHPSGDHS